MVRSAASCCIPLILLAKEPVTLDAVLAPPPPSIDAVWDPGGGRFVWRKDAKLEIFDVAAKARAELLDLAKLESDARPVPESETFGWTNRGVKESAIQWSRDGQQLLLSLKGDLFLVRVSDKSVRQLTRTPVEERDPKFSPDGRRVSFHQGHDLHTLDVASGKTTRLTRDGSATRLNAELDWVYPEELALSTAHWWSPDSRSIAFLQFDTSGVMAYPHGELTKLRPVYEPERFPQAGTPNPKVRLGVAPGAGGKIRWIDLGSAEHLVARVTWLPDGSHLAVHRLNRIQNRLDLLLASVRDGKVRTILEETDRAWINLKDDFRFLAKSRELIWGSERSGFRHLYLRSLDGGEARPITQGDWEVTELACVDDASRRLFYVSTEAGARERHLYTIGFDGSGKRRLTETRGTHAISMPESCASYLDRHSSLVDSPGQTLHSADGARVAELLERPPQKHDLLPSEFVDFRAADGDLFHARLIKPAAFDPARKYPALIQVYGGPHAQNVRDQWRGADWDQYLAHRGFVIWQMDNRGTAGRGHAWEARLHRRFGKQELSDQLEGVRHLISLGFVDPQRIAINGWSYGGFMTLYSLFNAPDVFRAGISGAPVTDWRQYDTIYTERYLGLPQENEEGYKASSPVHQAAELRGKLLLVHNFQDDNVLFQHSLRMMDALQKAGKQYETLIYPQKTHAVTGPVRKHMLEAMTAFVERSLSR